MVGTLVPSREPWASRHAQVLACLRSPAVQMMLHSLCAELPVPRPATSVAPPNASSSELDLAMAAWYPVSSSIHDDDNALRRAAHGQLQALASLSLQEKDFIAEVELNRNMSAGGGGFCEVMRCRLDRQLYVVKSAVKRTVVGAFAVSNLSPSLERHILTLARSAREGLGELPTPEIHAAWTSRNDVFIAMQYFPAGDLDMLMRSASEAGENNDLTDAHGRFREEHVRSWGRDMVAGVSWLHETGYMHRDIKPANWLIADSGHLKLCDFGIAAPFSHYAEPSEGSASGTRRRVHHSHNCIAGTSDYLAPELLQLRQERAEAADSRMNWRDAYRPGLTDLSPSQRWDDSSVESTPAREQADAPRADGEGSYGPDVDWWGVGLILYEMTHSVLPFQGTPTQVVEQKLNFANTFRVDRSIPRSDELWSVISALVAPPEQRLGRTSSDDVKAHPFFRGTQWAQPYAHAAPFRPRLSPTDPTAEPEVSVVHSPRAAARGHSFHDSLMSPSLLSSFDGSRKFAGIAHIPHMDETARDIYESPPTQAADAWERAMEGRWEESPNYAAADSSDTVVHSSPTARALERRTISRSNSHTSSLAEDAEDEESCWQDVDTYFVGLSLLPEADAFKRNVKTFAADALPTSTPAGVPYRAAANVYASPDGSPWPDAVHEHSSAPTASTPFGKMASAARAMPTPPALSTPWHGSLQRPLHRRAVEMAGRAVSNTHAPTFVTPLRKTSMPSLGADFRANAGAQHSAAALAMTSVATPGVPSSPYPFPLATGVRIRRNDLDRARSATPGAEASLGPASSECSGGSNARRALSEREAWNEMWTAAASVRKPRRPAAVPLARSPMPVFAPTRPRLPHSATAPGLSGLGTQALQAAGTLPPVAKDDMQLPVRSLSAALMGAQRVAQLPRFLHHADGAVLQPVVTLASPSRSAPPPAPAPAYQDAPLSARLGMPSSSAAKPEYRDAAVNTSASLALPAVGGRLQKRRSARQLLLKAQEKTTPTKAARVSSPLFVTSFDQLSPPRSAAPPRWPSPEAEPLEIAPDASLAGSAEATKGSRSASPPISSMALLGAPILGGPSAPERPEHVRLRSEEGPGRMRRRDSREMLAEFRQGVVRGSSEDKGHRLAKSRSIGTGLGQAGSPSMPSLTDAFGADGPAQNRHAPRRASLQPLRNVQPMRVPSPPAQEGAALEKVPETQAPQPPRRRSSNTAKLGRTLSKRHSEANLALPRPRWASAAPATTTSTLTEEPAGDVSATAGLGNRHRALQTSLVGMEARIARLKAMLREEGAH